MRWASHVVGTFAGQSLVSIERVLQYLEKEFTQYLCKPSHATCFLPSKVYALYLHDVLFPFQLYLLSQAEGDTTCQRTESVILEGYLMILLSMSIRIINKVIGCLQQRPEDEAILFTSLSESVVGVLLSYLLSFLYVGTFSHHVASTLRSDLNDLTCLWCRRLCLGNIQSSIQQNKEDILATAIYVPEFTTIPSSPPWHLTLFDLMVTANTRYHYSCLHFNYIETREDIRCLLESFIFSGGLKLWAWLCCVTCRESKGSRFIQSVYENECSEYDLLHHWLDSHFPEPLWKRKKQPIQPALELKFFALLVYLCRYEDLLEDRYSRLVGRCCEAVLRCRVAGEDAAHSRTARGAVEECDGAARAPAEEEAGVRVALGLGHESSADAVHGRHPPSQHQHAHADEQQSQSRRPLVRGRERSVDACRATRRVTQADVEDDDGGGQSGRR